MKSLACFLIILMVQRLAKCNHEDDRHVEDHSHEEDREHVNEWVVHIPKGHDAAKKFCEEHDLHMLGEVISDSKHFHVRHSSDQNVVLKQRK